MLRTQRWAPNGDELWVGDEDIAMQLNAYTAISEEIEEEIIGEEYAEAVQLAYATLKVPNADFVPVQIGTNPGDMAVDIFTHGYEHNATVQCIRNEWNADSFFRCSQSTLETWPESQAAAQAEQEAAAATAAPSAGEASTGSGAPAPMEVDCRVEPGANPSTAKGTSAAAEPTYDTANAEGASSSGGECWKRVEGLAEDAILALDGTGVDSALTEMYNVICRKEAPAMWIGPYSPTQFRTGDRRHHDLCERHNIKVTCITPCARPGYAAVGKAKEKKLIGHLYMHNDVDNMDAVPWTYEGPCHPHGMAQNSMPSEAAESERECPSAPTDEGAEVYMTLWQFALAFASDTVRRSCLSGYMAVRASGAVFGNEVKFDTSGSDEELVEDFTKAEFQANHVMPFTEVPSVQPSPPARRGFPQNVVTDSDRGTHFKGREAENAYWSKLRRIGYSQESPSYPRTRLQDSDTARRLGQPSANLRAAPPLRPLSGARGLRAGRVVYGLIRKSGIFGEEDHRKGHPGQDCPELCGNATKGKHVVVKGLQQHLLPLRRRPPPHDDDDRDRDCDCDCDCYLQVQQRDGFFSCISTGTSTSRAPAPAPAPAPELMTPDQNLSEDEDKALRPSRQFVDRGFEFQIAGTGKSNLGSSLSQNASTPMIDLSTVDRESLPLGVTRLYGKRMKLDVRSNPAMIDLRMNYRNLLNEFKVHNGKIVSNQTPVQLLKTPKGRGALQGISHQADAWFVLMKPRPKAALNKPKALEYPEGVNKAVPLRAQVAQMRAKAKEDGGPLPGSPKSARSGNDDLLPVEEDVDEDGSPRSKPDPTLQKEVREIARNAKVQATHSSMEYPPNSGNGGPGNYSKL
ncbi:hypothetical protein AK812_SmicGene36900 [Symbiodinium microadriaticum]|uniref:Uncharacterized protein n=1 Tax=Symbiodinium microadriaticum TaxID=2951 RepID=A0A1Q9CHN2_SYMMI|nr:hypothetical protein AK812_SmicGene36900 [Symbiodinium microadriaticum]